MQTYLFHINYFKMFMASLRQIFAVILLLRNYKHQMILELQTNN